MQYGAKEIGNKGLDDMREKHTNTKNSKKKSKKIEKFLQNQT